MQESGFRLAAFSGLGGSLERGAMPSRGILKRVLSNKAPHPHQQLKSPAVDSSGRDCLRGCRRRPARYMWRNAGPWNANTACHCHPPMIFSRIPSEKHSDRARVLLCCAACGYSDAPCTRMIRAPFAPMLLSKREVFGAAELSSVVRITNPGTSLFQALLI